MINHEEIKNLVTQWELREDVIEKDYVIGWVLWGIGQEPELNHKWIFKGGTCLKKCYLETYRFSEDLDFTVLPDSPLKPDDILPILTRILTRVSDESGINFSTTAPRLKQKDFPLYTEGRIYYQGPRNTPSPASIKLDLSASEKLARPPIFRAIAHNSYSDKLPETAQVMCYSFEEIFAEKIRAMGERGMPRDLYDIIFLFRNSYFKSQNDLIKSVLETKCQTKGVPIPTFESIKNSPRIDELKGEWSNMLAHQLPVLPPFEEFWNELPKLFDWLEGKFIPEELVAAPAGKEKESTWQPPTVAWNWGSPLPLESIRFAAVNHLCVELGYNGTKRIIEPYSLRRTEDGNLILHTIKVDTREPRAYRVDRIQSIKVTTKPFKPVYQIEFSSSGTIYAPPTSRSPSSVISSSANIFSRSRSPYSIRRTPRIHHGPSYMFQCTLCGKKFTRSKHDSRLKPHKSKSGWDCSGRTGMYIGTK
jgi:predicted nucleotidyltransferase component of viral defense system